MTTPTDASTADGDGEGESRYGTIETEAGETIIYDRESPEAWVQSDLLVDCES